MKQASHAYPEDQLVVQDAEALFLLLEPDVVADPTIDAHTGHHLWKSAFRPATFSR